MRIPLTHGQGHQPIVHGVMWDCTDAPFVEGELHLPHIGHPLPIQFLVDTGASSTSINGATIAEVATVYPQGAPNFSGGVGGAWPVANFRNARYVVPLQQGDLELSIPLLSLMSPYVRRQGQTVQAVMTVPRPPPPTARPATIQRFQQQATDYDFCKAPNLLGRDVFRANFLALDWDPLATSHIRVGRVAAQATVGGPAAPPPASSRLP